MTDVGSARVQVEGDVRGFARQTQRDLNRALDQVKLDPVEVPVDRDAAGKAGEQAGEDLGEGVRRGADGKLRDLKGRFVTEGEKAGKAGGEAAGRAFSKGAKDAVDKDRNRVRRTLINLFDIGKDATRALAGSVSTALSVLPSLIGPSLIVAGLAIAAGLAAVIGPALGGLIASAVLAAGGLGFIGLGAMLLKEEPALKSAAKTLASDVKEAFADAAQPILGPLIGALNTFRSTALRIAPEVKGAFADIAPAIEPFARGLAGLVQSALPGFLALIKAANPFLQGMAAVLPDLGRDFSAFFSEIAASGPAATVFFQDFIHGVGALIRNLGELIGWLANSYVKVKQFLSGFDSWGELFSYAVDWIQNLVTQGLQYLAGNLPSIIQKVIAFRQQVTDAILQMVTGVANALPTLIPQIVQGVIGLVTALVNSLAQTLPKVVEAAGQLLNGLVEGITNALPTLIPAVIRIVTTLVTGLIGLIPQLISAGLKLVQGLIEGIIGALPALYTALLEAIPQITSALLNAIPQLLLLGTDLMVAIITGLGNAIPQLVSQLQSKVFPAILNTLQTQGPRLIEQGAAAITKFMQGWVDNIGTITSIVQNAIIPAITTLLQNAPQFITAGIAILRQLLDGLVQNIGLITNFITNVFLPQFTALLNNPQLIQAGINLITTLINAMVSADTQIIGFIAGTLIPVLVQALVDNAPQLTSAAVTIINALVLAFIQNLPLLVRAGTQIVGAVVIGIISIIGSVVSAAVRVVEGFIGTLVLQGVSRARSAMNSIRDAIVGAASAAYNWLVGAGGRIVSGLVSGITGAIGKARSAIGSIKSAVTGAFDGAGSWLVSAGSRIISGLVSGLRAGFDRVRSTLSSLTSLLPDWKGPARVDDNLLRLPGRRIMKSLQRGFLDEVASTRKLLQKFTSDLPDFSVGFVGRNPGTTTSGGGSAGSGRITNVTIAPGAIVVQGTGAEAGQEAAEAILAALAGAQG